jgi:hypothetical protein
MEQHPVPQNVTTFQFRLIGDMTLKQFGYLIAGGILAVIAYKLPLPFIITWPLAGAFAFLGVGFAFIPVEERPMDVWVFSFFKSVYSPTQYIWSHTQTPEPVQMPTPVKQPVPPPSPKPAPVVAPQQQTTPAAAVASPSQKTVLSNLFQPTPSAPTPVAQSSFAVPPARHTFLDDVSSFFHPKPHPAPAPSAPVTPIPSVIGHHPAVPQPIPQQVVDPQANSAMHQKMASLEATLKNLEEKLSTKTVTEDRVLELQKQLTEVMAQKAKTEEELIALKRQANEPPAPRIATPAKQTETAPAPPLTPASRGAVNVITTQEGAVKAGLPRLTNVPNVVTGLVKDDAGNFLPGILVTLTNAEGVPVRALKTNKLGQFAASTQLASGTYFVEIEDPRARFTFSRVQITLNGAVVPVLEIIAKSEKVLTREKLAQEIFGKTT